MDMAEEVIVTNREEEDNGNRRSVRDRRRTFFEWRDKASRSQE